MKSPLTHVGRGVRSAAVATALGLLLGFSHDAMAADPYDIYVVAPLTGNNAFSGNAAKEGLAALQTVTNANGGIKGRPVNFVYLDTQSSPQTAVQLTNDIVAKKPPLFIGDLSVAGCNAMAPLVEKQGPVEFCLSPGYRPVKGGYIYTLGLPAIEQIKVVFRFLRENNLNRIALLVGTDATGRLAEPEFATVAGLPENRETQLVTVEHFNPTDVTIAAQVARIRAANAQAVIIWVNGSPFGTAVRSMKDAGMQLPVVAVTGNLSYTELHTFADALPNQLYFTWTAVPASDQPVPNGPLKNAQTAYSQTFKKIGVKPEYGQAAAWDTGVVAISALRAVGTDASPDQVRNYVNALHDLPGVQAMYDFRSGDMRGVPNDAARMLQWDKSKETWFIVSGPGGAKR
jgi:branched-chain amino acid transport system substrate-binding protein